MRYGIVKLAMNWLVATLAIVITAYLVPGVVVSGFFAALVTALVLGIINAFLRPLLLVLTLPINVLTLGLFTLVINAALIMLTSALVQGFYVPGFWWALLFSVVLMLVNTGLHLLERGRNF
jgi:putative membrane protein